MGRTALTVFGFESPEERRSLATETEPEADWAWSPWYPLASEPLGRVPDDPGVYEIRMQGSDSIVFIGSPGDGGLSEGLGNRVRHPDRALSGYEKELLGQGRILEFRFATSVSQHQAQQRGAERLHQYMEAHGGHAPPGNDGAP